MAAALENLASTQVRDLLAKSHSEERGLSQLYHECRLAGLVTASPVAAYEMDDVRRLQTLFDVALENGLTYVVIDYLNEICHDDYAVSSDAFEARLMEPAMVRDWCHTALQRIHGKVCQASDGDTHLMLLPIPQLAEAGALRAQADQLGGLLAVLRALKEPGEDLCSAVRLHHCLQAAIWCHRNGLTEQPPTGRHGSRPAWARRCSERDKALAGSSGGHSLFLEDLCREAVGGNEAVMHLYTKYPPPSLEHSISGLFLRGSDCDQAWRAKLAVFLYYLEDAGLMAGAASELIAPFRRTFHVSVREIKQWRAAYLLDSTLTDNPDNLDEACSLLLDAGCPATPFKYAALLSKAFGRHSTALSLLRAGVGQATSACLSQAVGAMDVRLECNILAEAYLEMRKHCEQVDGRAKAEHRTALLQHLLEWAVKQKALDQVLSLPLSPEEEATLHSWVLHGKGARLGVPRELLSLYYVQRGRIPEALLCSGEGTQGGNSGQTASRLDPATREGYRTMLAAAQQALPMAQHHLCAAAQGEVGPLPGAGIGLAEAVAAPLVSLKCSQPPGGHAAPQMDVLPWLQATPASTPALLGSLLVHQGDDARSCSDAQGDGMKVDEPDNPVSPLLGPGPSPARPLAATAPSSAAGGLLDSAAGAAGTQAPRDPPRGLLFSSRPGTAAVSAEGQDPSQQPPQGGSQSNEDFVAAMLEPAKKRTGRQPAKRARTARKQ